MSEELQEKLIWDRIRPSLNNSYDYNTGWLEAIELFRRRMNRKFFSPIQLIIENNLSEGEGFAIVTIQCAIIESLASFRTGEIFSYESTGIRPTYFYKKSGKMFIKFLHTDSVFIDNFYRFDSAGNKITNEPFNADDFYDCVRCGLMHEARTKGQWTINVMKTGVTQSKVFIEKEENKIKVYRTVLHNLLKVCVDNYMQDLKHVSSDKNPLRRLFARKLDHLFDIASDTTYDWWEDR